MGPERLSRGQMGLNIELTENGGKFNRCIKTAPFGIRNEWDWIGVCDIKQTD